MEQLPLNNPAKHPRLNQCYLCKAWHLEANLQVIEVPDQGNGWVEKKACQKCLPPIIGEDKPVSP